MTSWTIFSLGVIAGLVWFGLAILMAAWFYRAKHQGCGDETGTEFPMHRNSV